MQPFVDNKIPFKDVIAPSNPKKPILHHLVSYANYTAVEFIVTNTPKEILLNLIINRDNEYSTCHPILHLAQVHNITSPYSYLHPARDKIIDNATKITKLLLSSLPSDVERIDFITKQKNLDGETALHSASKYWNYNFARPLLSKINNPSDRIKLIMQEDNHIFSAFIKY